ncbi:hypothetical protein [Vibrio mytili]|uniref:Uncharacterized protein n=1 Tax=Vibrio mytili TaxID=50718 RepID=A0A0C3I2N7_9VIBR|nr:hypothetical protein [Vibrio mytili]KIN09355.1 hypothetical protein SU60_20120 [Vibrio mytili]
MDESSIKDVLLKSWELTQNIAKNNAETAWKVRMWGVAIWSALIAYAFKNNSCEIVLLSGFILMPIAWFEFGIRTVEYKLISRSHEIENSINSLFLGGEFVPPTEGVKIKIDPPSLSDYLLLFDKRRWLVWGPYLALFISSILALLVVLNKVPTPVA